MGCPFAGRATRVTANGERVTVRVCAAMVYERDEDPNDLPLPAVCFSETAWRDCHHYRRVIQRKEIAAWVGLTGTGRSAIPDAMPWTPQVERRRTAGALAEEAAAAR